MPQRYSKLYYCHHFLHFSQQPKKHEQLTHFLFSFHYIIDTNRRHSSPSNTLHSVNSLWIFGGYDGSYKSDLYEFDFLASKWSAIVAAGRRPRARYRATLSVHKNSLILYGGHDGTRHLSDTHVFDIDTKTWSSLAMEGTPPTPRDSHVSVVHGNSMYIFGGSSGAAMNDLHELQLPSSNSSIMSARWRAVSTGTTTNNNTTNAGNNNGNNAIVAGGGTGSGGGVDMPRRRFCHVAVVYQDSMYVFGGYDGSERLSDFIKFDFTVYDMSFEVPPSSIISDFRAMINDSTLSDIKFIVEGLEIYAHKLMLIRCSYFQSLFLGGMMESRLSTIRIEQVRHPM
jgi:leucine-zipper-like transcriptional regulator 1